MKSIKTQEDIKNLILQIEDKWAVDKWMVNGTHVWPYVRIKLYIHLLSSMHANSTEQNFKDTTKIKKTFNLGSKIEIILKLIRGVFRLPFFFLSLKRKKILFFGAHYHRVLQDGNYFNRFYDAMVDHHKLQKDVYMLEYTTVYKSIYNKGAVIDLNKYLNDYKLLFKFFNKFKQSTNIISLDGYAEFYKNLNEIQIDLNALRISEIDIIKWAIKINSIEGFFSKMYKKIKPSRVFFLGYYGLDNVYAALIVANKLGIKTIDFQHGTQIGNLAFSNWSKIPMLGYNTMVKEFWNWDQESKNNIDNWACNNVSFLKTLVVGQPFVSYWLKRQMENHKDTKVIVYSLHLSKIEDMITSKIIRLIKETNYKWILRLHPRNKLTIKSIKDYLNCHEIENKAIIQNSIEMALPEVFSSSLLHVTNFSGCLIEARMMGVPTLIIDSLGKEIFDKYIDEKSVYYSNKESTTFESEFQGIIKKAEKDRMHIENIDIVNPLL